MNNSYSRLLSTILLIILSNASFSQSGIYESYVIIDTGSGNQLYDLHSPTDTTTNVPTFDFNNSNLGVFGTQNGSLVLNGGQNNIYKCPNTDVTSGYLNYRIYPSGSPTGAFTGVSLNSSVSTSSGAICSGGFNQMWVTNNVNLNLINGLTSGDYTLEVYTLADNTSFGVAQTPHYVNNNGNNFTATFRADNPPEANCQNITIQLDASGNASITGNDIDDNSTDDFGIASLALSQTTFTCANLGPNNIILTVTDSIGQTDTCNAIVTVEDSVANSTASISSVTATLICQGQSVTFNASGTNLGLNPQYEWFVNGFSVGNNNDVYTTNTLNNGDDVHVEISSTSCSGVVTASSSSLNITVDQPATADAGIDASMCRFDTLALFGVYGGSATSGSWSSASGGFTTGDTYFPSISNGTVTLFYTTNDPPGPCGPAVDSIEVTVYYPYFATANNLTTITDCNDTTIQLQGLSSGNLGGQWSAVSVPAGRLFSFSNINDPNATFTGESGANYDITWTTNQQDIVCAESDTISVSFPSCGDFIDFDGTNDYINFENNNGLSSAFSIEAWIKPNVINANIQSILSKRDSNDLTTGYDIRLVNNTISFNANGYSISTNGINANRWYHIAVTYDGTDYSLYVDGIIRNTSPGPSPTANTHNMLLGAMNRSNAVPINYFNGWMDEIRFWNTALTTAQIREMMNQEIEDNTAVRGSVLELDISGLNWTNLDAYYQMNQGTANLNSGFLVGNVGVSGRLANILTFQDESAPLPYTSANDGSWDTANTWLNGNVQMTPNTNNVDWNIVRTSHNINSGNRTTTLLGLLVDSNTYSITDNQSLMVSKYLKIDGVIDLRNESQLIQDTGSIVDYSGIGYVERDQQGSTNLYHYNFWSSPVGSNNNTFSISNVLYDGTDASNPLPLQWTPNNDANGTTVPITISRRWLYLYENYPEASYADWNPINENTTIPVGLGFTMKGSGNSGLFQNYTFRGQPNNGLITTPISPNYQALVGNPYTSALDGYAFINDNNSVLSDGTLYFWEQSSTSPSHNLHEYEGGYAYLNLTGGTSAVSPPGINGVGDASKVPQQYVPIGQSFFVTGNATGGNIEFNNAQRAFVKESGGNSIFLRNANPVYENVESNNKYIRLDFISPENAVRHLLLGFMNSDLATQSIDYGYDAPNNDDFPNDMSFDIDGKPFIIQGVGNFDETKTYPLTISLTYGGNIQIHLDNIENFDEDLDVYIYDAHEDSYTSIKTSNFEKELDEGIYKDRFFLVFQENATLSTISNELNDLEISYIQTKNEILIKNTGTIQVKEVSLINLIGQIVTVWDISSSMIFSDDLRIPVNNISEGNYILKVETQHATYNKKLIIKY